jgi:hypothetical protein
MKALLHDAMVLLPESYRRVFEMRDIQEIPGGRGG